MDFVSGDLALSTINLPNAQLSYYATISELTPKQAIAKTRELTQAEENQFPQVSAPIIVYAPILIFFGLFLGAFIVQVINKTINFKRGVMAVIIALFAASIPVVLPYIKEGTGHRTQASPNMTPRNLEIIQLNDTSALVVWNTLEKQIGAVRYGLFPIENNKFQIIISNFGTKTDSHTVEIKELAEGIVYELEILSGGIWYDNKGDPIILKLR